MNGIMDIGKEEAFIFGAFCFGTWCGERLLLPPKLQPTKSLYATSESMFWDYRGVNIWWEDTKWE